MDQQYGPLNLSETVMGLLKFEPKVSRRAK